MNETLRPWRRLLDGGRTWGSLRIDANHYGVVRYKLVVFPPGISGDERVLLRLWRTWPLWGLVLFLFSDIVLTQFLAPTMALVISLTLTLGGGAVAMALAGNTRAAVRSLAVVVVRGYEDPESDRAFHRLDELATLLVEADHHLNEGVLTPTEHEAVVWRVYDRLAPSRDSAPQAG